MDEFLTGPDRMEEVNKPKRRNTTIVYVRWFDSSITKGEVATLEEAAWLLENETAGILVLEDKKCITLAMDRCIDTGGLRCTICIPKVNIRSIKRFNTNG